MDLLSSLLFAVDLCRLIQFRPLLLPFYLSLVFSCPAYAAGDIVIWASRGNDREQLVIRVSDPAKVSRRELERIIQFLEGRGQFAWDEPPMSGYYVHCPYVDVYGNGWTPCVDYDRALFVKCVSAHITNDDALQHNRFVKEDCYLRSTDPSFLDRLRYR